MKYFLPDRSANPVTVRVLRPNHFKNVTYHFTHWGMEKIGKGIDFTRSWNEFLKYHESAHFIFLIISEKTSCNMRLYSSPADLLTMSCGKCFSNSSRPKELCRAMVVTMSFKL